MRRFLALAILAFLLLGIWAAVVAPIAGAWTETSASIALNRRLLAGYQAALRDKGQWESLAATIQDDRFVRAFTGGDDANIAAAKFQADVKRMVEENGGTISSIQVLPVAAEDGLSRLTTRVVFSASLFDLTNLLKRAEYSLPYVFLDSLSLGSSDYASGGAGKLTVYCDFQSYLRPKS